MNLELQIQSLISSFVYGMYLSLTYNLLYKYLYANINVVKIITNALYTIINVIIYFLLLQFINEGIVHPYFLICLLIGFIIGNRTTRKIRTKPLKRKEKKSIEKDN